MFDFIKRLFGGSGGGGAKEPARPKPERDRGREAPARDAAWVAAQQKRLREHFAAEALFDEGAEIRPAWVLAPHVVVWTIPGGWAISGAVPFDHTVDQNDVLRSPRDAARHFGRKLRERARLIGQSKGSGHEADTLARQAEAVLTSVKDDTGWPDEFPLDEATLAPGPTAWQRADRLLAGTAFKPERDPALAPHLRIVVRREAAPGGTFYGVFLYLDASVSTPELFDGVARKLQEIEAQFAPLVAHRVRYALVLFGINFGNPKQEIEAFRQADRMRQRHPELSRRLDDYSTRDADMLPIHVVDDTDQPWTAHPCVVRDPSKPYKAEEEYFNCRDQEFHKSMETSPDVGLRLIARSIDPDVVAEARKLFQK